jgi:hypothetical protein
MRKMGNTFGGGIHLLFKTISSEGGRIFVRLGGWISPLGSLLDSALTDDVTITLRIVSLIRSPRDTPLVTSTNSMTSDAKNPSLI